jgi:hypothetical protein
VRAEDDGGEEGALRESRHYVQAESWRGGGGEAMDFSRFFLLACPELSER